MSLGRLGEQGRFLRAASLFTRDRGAVDVGVAMASAWLLRC